MVRSSKQFQLRDLQKEVVDITKIAKEAQEVDIVCYSWVGLILTASWGQLPT